MWILKKVLELQLDYKTTRGEVSVNIQYFLEHLMFGHGVKLGIIC